MAYSGYAETPDYSLMVIARRGLVNGQTCVYIIQVDQAAAHVGKNPPSTIEEGRRGMGCRWALCVYTDNTWKMSVVRSVGALAMCVEVIFNKNIIQRINIFRTWTWTRILGQL